jgi:hypothetical protein
MGERERHKLAFGLSWSIWEWELGVWMEFMGYLAQVVKRKAGMWGLYE